MYNTHRSVAVRRDRASTTRGQTGVIIILRTHFCNVRHNHTIYLKCYKKFTIYEIIDLVYQDVYNLRSNMLNIFIDEIDNFTESDRQALINKVPDPIKDNIKNVLQTSYEYAQYRKRLLKKYGRIWFYKWLENSYNPQGCPKYITPYNPQGFGTQYIKFKKEAEELYN